MAQHDYVIANGTGAAVRSDLNNALAAIVTQNSGATAPATTYAYQWWADTTTGLLKLRNAANSAWITLFQLDGEWSTIAVENGTAGAPSIYFKDSGTDTGIYSPGADQVAISTGGTGRLFIDSSGRLGLGTSAPGDYASGANNLVIGNTSAANGLTILTGTTNSGGINFADGTGGTDRGRIDYDHGDDRMRFYTASSQRAVIDSSGRLGIGTTSPSQKLAVYSGTTNSAANVTVGDTQNRINLGWIDAVANITLNGTPSQLLQAGVDTALVTRGDFASNLLFYTSAGSAATERARIDSSGRLLVGTSSSSATNTVVIQGHSGGGTGQGIVYLAKGAATPADGDQLGAIWFSDNTHAGSAGLNSQRDGGTWSASSKPSRLVFSTTADGASSPTERVRIASDGAVFVAKTGYATGTAGIELQPTGSVYATRDNNLCALFNRLSSDGTLLLFQRSTTSVGSITVTSSSTAYNTSSDYRLKENVVPLTGAADRINQLQVHRFNFIADPDTTVDGFIAHEAQAVVPECVTGTKDEVDADGNPVYQGIDQSKLVPLLTAALQEAIGRIETLEAEVAALKGA